MSGSDHLMWVQVIGVVMVGQNITEMLMAQREATRVAEDLMQLIDNGT